MAELNLEIITPERSILKDEVESITVPGTLGGFQILRNHAPLISTFEIGIITVKKNGTISHFTTSGGTVEVDDNKILVLADSVEKVENIDLHRAEKAKERAEQRLKSKKENLIDEARAEAAFKRALNRINAANKYK